MGNTVEMYVKRENDSHWFADCFMVALHMVAGYLTFHPTEYPIGVCCIYCHICI
jgi:hypothetical protein